MNVKLYVAPFSMMLTCIIMERNKLSWVAVYIQTDSHKSARCDKWFL